MERNSPRNLKKNRTGTSETNSKKKSPGWNLKMLQTMALLLLLPQPGPAQEFSVNRGFFKTMTHVHTNNSLQNSLA